MTGSDPNAGDGWPFGDDPDDDPADRQAALELAHRLDRARRQAGKRAMSRWRAGQSGKERNRP